MKNTGKARFTPGLFHSVGLCRRRQSASALFCTNRAPFSLENNPTGRNHLAENSKSRIQAEAAFLKIQAHALPGTRIISEADIADLARDANTARLKELRLNREALDRAAATAVPPKPKMRKSSAST
ncbi:hypothetical protein [Bosea sp. 685]|uniref:hypothetical protein n=1 Tax=Bosea sp. 685 TaxID=3080057 RepID=UPI002892FDAF|nr:hypothetical protein [Bosea sp. 685]WNJ89820.1 hypothetical protein RMR04_26050 [Bosea sp. 685]